MKRPKLRLDVQLTPFQHQNEYGYILRDALTENRVLFINEGAALLIPFLDGNHTIEQMKEILERRTGQVVQQQEIERLVQLFEENLFLDTPAYHQYLEDVYRSYKNGIARPSLMAGNGYPARAEDLKQYLDTIFEESNPNHTLNLPEKLEGIVVPHVDIERGKKNYATIFSLLKNYPAAQTYVILGVNHHYFSDNPFIFTNKAYETPLGKLEIDSELLEDLQNSLNWNIFDAEIAHKGEHSIEIPSLFLNYIYPNQKINILPILCNFHDKNDDRIDALISGLQYYLNDKPENYCLIASVDFSHIGPQFGWNHPVKETDAAEVKERDLKTLQFLANGEANSFYFHIMQDGNKRHIDALGAGYVFSRVLEGVKGQLVRYDQAFNPVNTVTFASLLF
ncbi:MAG: AmmeMemoRadiSam system protein B [Candidatus Hodarchaeales archaeon]|jgi:AmmeMemoRadiSam system protein B